MVHVHKIIPERLLNRFRSIYIRYWGPGAQNVIFCCCSCCFVVVFVVFVLLLLLLNPGGSRVLAPSIYIRRICCLVVCLFPNNSRSRQPNNVKFGTRTQNYTGKVIKQVSFHIYKILGPGGPKCSFSLYELYKIKIIEN